MDSANKVFESINDVSLNDILEYECYVKMSEWEKKKYNNKNFFLHISELSFEKFAKYFDKPIQEKPNTRYFMIIEPHDPEQYLKFRNMSVILNLKGYYIDSQHHIKRYTSEVVFLEQHETFDKEFNKNLQNEIIKYLKTDQVEIYNIMLISREDFINATGIDKKDTNNIEYVQVILTDLREGVDPADFGMLIRLINDNSKVTLLDVDTNFVE